MFLLTILEKIKEARLKLFQWKCKGLTKDGELWRRDS